MKTVTIYGQSDDCIEVDGDLSEEFNTYDKWKYLHFNDGTIVKIGYGMKDAPPTADGKRKGWHVEVVTLGNMATAKPLDPEMDDGDHYTDRLQLTGVFTKVACRKSAGAITLDEIKEFFEDFTSRDYTDRQLRAAYAALTASK